MSNSIAARKFLTKYLGRKFSYILREIFVIFIYIKRFASWDCLVSPRLKFISMCGTIRSLKSTHAESFLLYSREWDTEKYTVTFSISSLVKISITWLLVFIQFFAWDYIINRTLHVGLKIWLLSSRVKNNILFTRCARS